MKKKKKKLDKATKIAIISTIAFLLVGITAFVVGFGIKDGWLAVAKWFVSRWAVYVYITLILLIFVLIWFIHKRRMEK